MGSLGLGGVINTVREMAAIRRITIVLKLFLNIEHL